MKKLLVIETEKIVCLDVKRTFMKHGFEVELLDPGKKELQMPCVPLPDLVLLDVATLKGIDYSGLCSGATIFNLRRVPIIVSYSRSSGEINCRLHEYLNVIGKVVKPYDTARLVDMYEKSVALS